MGFLSQWKSKARGGIDEEASQRSNSETLPRKPAFDAGDGEGRCGLRGNPQSSWSFTTLIINQEGNPRGAVERGRPVQPAMPRFTGLHPTPALHLARPQYGAGTAS